MVKFSLSYSGGDADNHQIDFYDVSQALLGFQRSLALTTHLVINGEVITQSPSLRGATIYALPAEESSWKIMILVAIGGYHALTTPRDTVLGHLVFSAYDYVISKSLGVHVDYDKSIGTLIEEGRRRDSELPDLRESQFGSVMEKCEKAITDMHRPISSDNATALQGALLGHFHRGPPIPVHTNLDLNTYRIITGVRTSERPSVFEGRISSYNSNTYRGRIFVKSLSRPIPFELLPEARTPDVIRVMADSLYACATENLDHSDATVFCRAYKNINKAGNLKSLAVVDASHQPLASRQH